ncbi:Uncharacterized protein FWK35_00036457, partial [Aphis craccivora]
YGRIALILVELHLGLKKVIVELHSGEKQVVVELHLGSKKVFQPNYYTFEGVKLLVNTHFPSHLYRLRTDNDFNHRCG